LNVPTVLPTYEMPAKSEKYRCIVKKVKELRKKKEGKTQPRTKKWQIKSDKSFVMRQCLLYKRNNTLLTKEYIKLKRENCRLTSSYVEMKNNYIDGLSEVSNFKSMAEQLKFNLQTLQEKYDKKHKFLGYLQRLIEDSLKNGERINNDESISDDENNEDINDSMVIENNDDINDSTVIENDDVINDSTVFESDDDINDSTVIENNCLSSSDLESSDSESEDICLRVSLSPNKRPSSIGCFRPAENLIANNSQKPTLNVNQKRRYSRRSSILTSTMSEVNKDTNHSSSSNPIAPLIESNTKNTSSTRKSVNFAETFNTTCSDGIRVKGPAGCQSDQNDVQNKTKLEINQSSVIPMRKPQRKSCRLSNGISNNTESDKENIAADTNRQSLPKHNGNRQQKTFKVVRKANSSSSATTSAATKRKSSDMTLQSHHENNENRSSTRLSDPNDKSFDISISESTSTPQSSTRSSRRCKKLVSYKEPSLSKKLRKGDKFF